MISFWHMNYASDPAIADSNLFGAVLKDIRKDSRSVHNRLRSIEHDSRFVLAVSAAYDLPLVANERCGRWYIRPQHIEESVYFKSTDGHTGQWRYSTRRQNLHILDMIADRGGMVIVDSTRRGKRMPDALSKTVPIWCAVLSCALFGMCELHLPPTAVSASEKSQISSHLMDWVRQFVRSGIDVPSLRAKLKKPLRPIWVTPDEDLVLPATAPVFDKFHPVVLCTASRMVLDGTERREGYTYVQGAADDHEQWASSLTPDLFWANEKLLLNASDVEIEQLLSTGKLQHASSITRDHTAIGPSGLLIGKAGVDYGSFTHVIDLAMATQAIDVAKASSTANKGKERILRLPLPEGKKGSKLLRTALDRIVQFYDGCVQHDATIPVLILCDTGSDISVGAALAIMTLYHDENGAVNKSRLRNAPIDKDIVRRRLTFIISQRKVNPSRATLQAVNSFLMS